MAKPTKTPDHATAVTGDATRYVEPTTTKTQGWPAGAKPAAQNINWLLYIIYEWCVWLRDFELTAHTWEAKQTYNVSIDVSNNVVNGYGITTTGNGTGYGIRAIGGIGGGAAVRAEGRGGLAVSATSDTATAVNVTGGTNQTAMIVAATGNASAASFTGAGTGHGIVVTGTEAVRATSATVALRCLDGGVRLDDNTDTIEYTNAKTYRGMPKAVMYYDTAEWKGEILHFNQYNAPGAGGTRQAIAFVMDVPRGATITNYNVRLNPADGHAALPAILPTIQLYSLDTATGTETNLDSTDDPSASLMTYEPDHLVSKTYSYTPADNEMIFLLVYGEKGADELDGLRVSPPYVTYTRSLIG